MQKKEKIIFENLEGNTLEEKLKRLQKCMFLLDMKDRWDDGDRQLNRAYQNIEEYILNEIKGEKNE